MKKRIVTIVLCLALSASFVAPVIATGASETATVEEAKPKKASKKKKLRKKLKKNYGLKFQGEVPNDVTGNWRWAEYDSDTGFEEFAVDYYKAYVKDDSEVHGIINRKTNVLYSLKCFYKLYVTSFEYTQGEENDAKAMFGGNLIADYEIDPYYEEGKSVQGDSPESSPIEFVPCNSEQQKIATSLNYMEAITQALNTAGIPLAGTVVTGVGNYAEGTIPTFYSVDFKIETADGHILLAECPGMVGDNYAFIRSIRDMNTGHAYYDDGGGEVYDYATDAVSDGPIRILQKYQ